MDDSKGVRTAWKTAATLTLLDINHISAYQVILEYNFYYKEKEKHQKLNKQKWSYVRKIIVFKKIHFKYKPQRYIEFFLINPKSLSPK